MKLLCFILVFLLCPGKLSKIEFRQFGSEVQNFKYVLKFHPLQHVKNSFISVENFYASFYHHINYYRSEN